MDPLFPALPDSLAGLSTEELAALLEEHRDAARKIRANDEEFLAGYDDPQAILDQLAKGVEQIKAIEAESAGRAEAEANYLADVDRLAAEAGIVEDEVKAEGDEGDDSGDGDGDDADVAEAAAEVVAEAEAVTEEAAAEPAAEPVVASIRRPLPSSRAHAPVAVVNENGPAIVASAGIDGVQEGAHLDRLGLAQAIINKRRRATSTPKGVREDVIVASIKAAYPEDRILFEGQDDANWKKIQNVTSHEAIVASGGLCAPVTPYYGLESVSVAIRPVRDALAGFNADRGGIRFAAPPVLGDVTTAVGVITAAEDGQGGTFATKSCQVVECPDLSEVDVEIIYHCVQFGNLGSRAWPEQVAQFNDLVMAAHARVAETELLNGISAASTTVTAAAATYGYGAVSNLLAQVLAAAAGIRSRNRMAPGTNLRVLLPDWAKSLLVADLGSSQFDRFARNVDGVAALFTANNINVSWYIDEATGSSQIFPAQADGALGFFPDTVVWYMYPEGSFLFVDGGTLELGIVRDSVLNSTNDYQIFGESFENVAFIGVESLEVTSAICANGTTGGTATAITC